MFLEMLGVFMEKLSNSEEKVMLVIWQAEEPLTYTDVQSGIEKQFGDIWKGQTVCTFIKRLKKKGYIETHKIGRFTQYKVLIGIEDYRKMLLSDIVERLYQGNRTKLVEELME